MFGIIILCAVIVCNFLIIAVLWGQSMFLFATDLNNAHKLGTQLFLTLFIKRDVKLDGLLSEVIKKCKSRGFPKMRLNIFKVRWCIFTDWNGQIHSNNYKGSIFIFNCNAFFQTDDELRILIAHEVCHQVNRITLKGTHSFIDRIRKFNLDDEDMVWCLVSYLYSREAVIKYIKRHSNFISDKLNNIEICNLLLVNNGLEETSFPRF